MNGPTIRAVARAEDTPTKLVPLGEPRPLTPREQALIDYLLDGPLGRAELREQAKAARVVSSCSCGCPSVGLDIDPVAPTAHFRRDETPLGRTDWVPITAFQQKAKGETEVTLHVVEGRLHELEVWAGSYGVRPRVDVTKLERDDWA